MTIKLSDFFGVGTTGGGGLIWSVVSTNITGESGNGYLFDNSSAAHTLTLPASPSVGDTVAAGDLGGDFATYALTIARNGSLIMGEADNLTLDVKNQRVTLVYSGATEGWVITDELFGAHPKTVLNKPFMHVQDQKAQGTAGGASIAGTQTRTLNTTVKNDITGASLASNQITLPAGDYFIDARCPAFANVGLTKVRLYDVTNAAYIMEGESSNGGSGGIPTEVRLKGSFTLAATTSLEVRHYTASAIATNGLGVAASQGVEIYTYALIWQLDRSLEIAPVAVNSGLQTVPGLDTTGNIMGFNLSKTAANQVTVSKGSCLDSTLLVPLALTIDTAVAIPAVANTIYHVFVVRLVADGSKSVKAYTTEAAVASDALVDKWRWVGFVKTNASTVITDFTHIEDRIIFTGTTADMTFLTSSNVSTTASLIDLSGFVPSNRVGFTYVSSESLGTEACYVSWSKDGTNWYGITTGLNVSALGGEAGGTPIEDGYYYKAVNTSNNHGILRILSVELRR